MKENITKTKIFVKNKSIRVLMFEIYKAIMKLNNKETAYLIKEWGVPTESAETDT